MSFSDSPVNFAGSKPSGLGWCWPRKARAGDFSCASKLPPAASEIPAIPAVSIFNVSRRDKSSMRDLLVAGRGAMQRTPYAGHARRILRCDDRTRREENNARVHMPAPAKAEQKQSLDAGRLG